MQKIILDTTKEFEENFLDGESVDDCGGAMFTVSGALDIAKHFFEAGQKSREKEIVKILQSVETIAEDEQKHHFTEHCPCLRYAIYKVENPDAEEMAYASSIKSLSLTKESTK